MKSAQGFLLLAIAAIFTSNSSAFAFWQGGSSPVVSASIEGTEALSLFFALKSTYKSMKANGLKETVRYSPRIVSPVRMGEDIVRDVISDGETTCYLTIKSGEASCVITSQETK